MWNDYVKEGESLHNMLTPSYHMLNYHYLNYMGSMLLQFYVYLLILCMCFYHEL